jgi:putative peptidoglycan lipid II flippase
MASLKVFMSSLKMAIATFCSRILGLVREQVLAYTFGASGFTDAFLIAYRIPNLLRDLFAEGAFSSAFVPTFVEANAKSKEQARKLFWSLAVLLTLTTLLISGFIFVFAPEIINIFAPTFYKTPEKYEVTITLTRIMSPFLTFVSLAALFMGVLNSLKIFFIPSFAPVFFNITMILSMLVLPPIFIKKGLEPILSLGVGVFFGGLLQAFVQFPLVLKNGFGPTKPDKIINDGSKKVIKLLGPGLIGFAATQINLLVNTILASGTVVGAVSWLSFAFRLFQLPVGILSVSIGNSNLVHFSNAWKVGETEKAKDFLKSSFFLSCFLVFPATIALIMCSTEMINVIFERGKFDTYSSLMTSKALKWYALGLPFYSMYKIFVPTFYAIDRQKIPVYCSIFGIAFNIIFCVLLVDDYGFEVLAIGTTISMFLNVYLQGMILKKDLSLPITAFLNLRLYKLIFAAGLSAFAVGYLKTFFSFYDAMFIERCLLLALYLGVIAMSYFSVCIALGERHMVRQFLSKFTKKR